MNFTAMYFVVKCHTLNSLKNPPLPHALQVAFFLSFTTSARPIRFFLGRYEGFSLPIPIFLYYSRNIYFASRGKINTPGAILPSAKHFQTTAERHCHIKKIISQVTIILRQNIYSYFTLR